MSDFPTTRAPLVVHLRDDPEADGIRPTACGIARDSFSPEDLGAPVAPAYYHPKMGEEWCADCWRIRFPHRNVG